MTPVGKQRRPRGLMDKASDFESEDCGFESRRGRRNFYGLLFIMNCKWKTGYDFGILESGFRNCENNVYAY